MRPRHLILLAPVLGGAFLLAARPTRGDDRIDPGKLFAKSCAACHAVPDPLIRTDRAWLDQVRRTT